MPFDFQPLALAGLQLIVPRAFPDNRGSFMETFRADEFARHGIPGAFLQENLSSSRKGVLRGLHFQRAPHAQSKLVQVLSGSIFDVVVDVRRDSPCFGKWIGLTLDAASHQLLYVPEGFAHGFQALSERADVLYKTGEIYHPESEAGIAWNDPSLAIPWPLAAPILSDKDLALPLLKDLP
jgi:dTDP-4-dehydrorhamnose 3,5-epimerase